MVVADSELLPGLAAQLPGRSAAKPFRDGQGRAEARSPTICRCSEWNVAGFVRLQRRVGQEVAASLLTVFPSRHDGHSTAIDIRWWCAADKTPGSMPSPPRSPLEHLAPLIPSSDDPLIADSERVDAFLPR
jgi:hypothetical protein